LDKFTKVQKRYFRPLILLAAGFLFFCIFALFSCKDQTNQTGPSDIIFPDSLVSFSKHVEPLFQKTCVASGCHGGSLPAANLDLDYGVSWHSLIDYLPPLVLVKNGKNSPLIMYLDGRLTPQMPLRSQPLTKNQIDGVKKWIDEGAKPN
jgi:hypothetical protein